MKPRDGKPARPRPLLSEEDRALWEHATRTLAPIKSTKAHVIDVAPRPPAMPADNGTAAGRRADEGTAKKNSRLTAAVPAVRQRPAPDLARFDRKAASRLRRGVTDIEARLDLHGMRQSEAHSALRTFLLGCQGRGLKWVLVITGKGVLARRDAHGLEPSGGIEREIGVLRRNVPRWLAEPELRAIVVSYESAALHHGGEGALYIHLRGRKVPSARS